MKFVVSLLLCIFCLTSCQSKLKKLGQHYQKNSDLESLQKVVDLLQTTTDTAYIRQILGTPIDMGFDYRYLTDQIGENDCVIGAVFHIDEFGKVDDRWVGEICE